MDNLREKLKNATVGVAGLGGLGSAVSWALARAGIGKLVIADFDKVDETNLGRQQYFVDQIGSSKVDSTIVNLTRVNPETQIVGIDRKLNTDLAVEIFADCDIVAECFDLADQKQMLVEAILCRTDKPIVAASGLAGYGKSNDIKTRRVNEQLVMVGDEVTGIDTEQILTAARVWIAAGHQANAIIEILADKQEKI